MVSTLHDMIYVKTHHMDLGSLLKNLLRVLKPLWGDYQKFFALETATGMHTVVYAALGFLGHYTA